MDRGGPMPACTRSRRSRTWSSTRICRPESLRRKLNDELPADIHIRAIDKAPHRFHARHDAVSRCYLYQISRRRTAFAKPFVWWIREPLDVAAMRLAAASFVGLKNFEAFTADDPADKSTRVLVDRVEIAEAGALLLIRVQGSHFLWKMVRRMVGVLAAVGRGDLKPPDAARLLDETEEAIDRPRGPRRSGRRSLPRGRALRRGRRPGTDRAVVNID